MDLVKVTSVTMDMLGLYVFCLTWISVVHVVSPAPVLSKCAPCSVGHRVVRMCNDTVEIQCAPCRMGSYTSSPSLLEECLPCSLCGEGMFELHACSESKDILCELCSWQDELENQDYMKKCVHTVNTFTSVSRTRYEARHKRDQPSQNELPESEPVGNDLKSNDEETDTQVTDDTKQLDSKNTNDKVIGNDDKNNPDENTESNSAQNDESGSSSKTNSGDNKPGGDESKSKDEEEKEEGEEEEEEEEEEEDADLDAILTEEELLLGDNAKYVADNDEGSGSGDVTDDVVVSPPITNLHRPKGRPVKVKSSETKKEEAEKEDGVPTTGIVITVIVVGILFGLIGFFAHRRLTSDKKEGYKPCEQDEKSTPSTRSASPIYRSPTTNGVKTNSAPPPAPPIAAPPPAPPSEPKRSAEEIPLKEDVDDCLPDPPPSRLQSPVDIDPEAAEVDTSLEKTPLKMEYVPTSTRTFTNTGSTVKVDVDKDGSLLEGGPLGDKKYCLDHVHLHWGSNEDRGSEHTIRGIACPAEIHLVHWNNEYSSFDEASCSEDGIAVLAVLVDVGEECNPSLALLSDCLPSIQFKEESREAPSGGLNLQQLIPANSGEYWTYNGSLSEPPLDETATWIVFSERLHVDADHLEKFRQLLTHEREGVADGAEVMHLVDNFRSIVPLDGRVVKASFA